MAGLSAIRAAEPAAPAAGDGGDNAAYLRKLVNSIKGVYMARRSATRAAESAAPAAGDGGDNAAYLRKLVKPIKGVFMAGLRAIRAAKSAAHAADDGGDDVEFRRKLVNLIKEWEEERQWVLEKRGWLTVLATVAVSIAYEAGLNPPGGFWQDDGNGHTAGAPVRLLREKSRRRYLAFYYLNSTTLLTSLVIIILLANKSSNIHGLVFASMLDIMSLVAAYIAGSAADMKSSIVLIVVACFIFFCIVYSQLKNYLMWFILVHIPCLRSLAMRSNWLPVEDVTSEQAAVQQQPHAEC